MDFSDFLNLRQGKPTAATDGLNRLRAFARLIRTVEVCVCVALLAWAFNRLPFVIRFSGEFLRRLAAVVSSPLFVFLLGNGIIAALVANFKSRSTSVVGANADEPQEEDMLYDVMVKSAGYQPQESEPTVSSTLAAPPHHPTAGGEEESVVYQDKEIILSQTGDFDEEKPPAVGYSSDSDSDTGNPKIYRRAKSEKGMERRRMRDNRNALRRCETMPGKEQSRPEDELSDEEFQRAVDEFIAKQIKFLREESLAVVVVNQHPNTDLQYPLVESVSS